MAMDFTELGKMIKYQRRSLGLTQEELAEEVGMTKAVLGQVERGERSITVERLVLLADRFGVTVDFLLNGYKFNEHTQVMKDFVGIMRDQPLERKQMAIDVLRTIFSHLNKENNK